MRILYGVVGEGMGHAIRSRVILEELTREHDVQIVVSGRAHDFLRKRFDPRYRDERLASDGRSDPGGGGEPGFAGSPVGERSPRSARVSDDRSEPGGGGEPGFARSPAGERSPAAIVERSPAAIVRHIWGLTMAYEDNEVKKLGTFLENARGAIVKGGWPENVARYFELMLEFAPQVVISDFESWSYLFGQSQQLPVLSVDNMQVINRCAHEEDVLRGHHADFQLAKSIVKAKCPFSAHYVASTFFYPPVRKERTTLVPPILRPEILAARAHVRRGDHLLVYQTSDKNSALPGILAASGVECRVYGLRRDLTAEVVEGNVRYRPFSEAGFIEDLATARAVVAGGGFTTMGEAVYLRKPFLSVPVGGQFEQVLNARYLEKLGYGALCEELSPEALRAFLANVPRHEAALATYDQDGNKRLFEVLSGLLDQAAAGLLAPGWKSFLAGG